MRWARLLHTPDRVEVLEVNTQTQKARICRHGFYQEVSLGELVFEEEEPSSPPSAAALSPPSAEGATLSVHLTAGQPEVTLVLRRDGSTPAYIGLYLRTGTTPLWHPLWEEVFEAGLSRLSKISQATYAPPWTLRMNILPLVHGPSTRLPETRSYEATLRPLFFARSGNFPITWTPLSAPRDTPALSEISAKETTPAPPPSTYDFPRDPEIDLHIEKLAPHLTDASGEVIFLYQKEVLERYLDWAYRERLPSVRVIHGKGMFRLRNLLLMLCERHGWKTELLMTPPYAGGATKVSF